MDVWDASLPGAGARRAMTILQLYMRMAHYNPLSILVADSLCLTFKSDGATVSELSAYLGLTQDRIEAGISGMPREVYCTSCEFSREGVCPEGKQREEGSTLARYLGDASKEPVGGDEGGGMRYYINYATFLPFAYAHGSHMLLCLCQLPLPKRGDCGGDGAALNSVNISPGLRRADCRSGLCCVQCCYWMGLSDLRSTVAKCPLCQVDMLDIILRDIKARYDAKLAEGGQLLVFGPLQQKQSQLPSHLTHSSEKSNEPPPKVTSDSVAHYPLARDPFLVQQALFFKFLYGHPFVCVNDGSFVVDANEVLTREEYAYRSRHKATVLDQFRLVHRNPGSIRVQLVDQAKLDEEKYAAAAMRWTKHMQLPPWLQSSGHSPGVDVMEVVRFLQRDGEKTAGSKRARRDYGVAAIASYVAKEFFDDDFDEVPLQRSYFE